LGVNTLELDVVVTKDNQILVSHDPFFNSIICLDSLGNAINEGNELNLNIYQTTFSQVQQYDCGSIKHPQFPEQINSKVSKPLLLDVIAQSELLSDQKILYNIEIKSAPDGDNKYHPTPQVFADLFIKTIQGRIPMERLTIQSFDFRVLRYIHEAYPDYKLAALVYKDNVKTNLDALKFIPDSYSPEHTLLTAKIVTELQAKGMKVIPWTINEASRMQTVLSWGVDGIITDYPDRGILFKK
jgi:glycerophosphoryl diester phosphodiesterase